MSGFADDYVQVNERLAAFYEKWPDGRITTEIVEHTAGRVTVRAAVYRSPDDPVPCSGHSSMGIPGLTPYTKGFELENCETSAVGRALAMAGFETKRAIASAEEVQSKAAPPLPRVRAIESAGPDRAASPADLGACPLHHKPWREGKRGWYCPTKVGEVASPSSRPCSTSTTRGAQPTACA